MPFQRGKSGNPKGRPKGLKDHMPRSFRALCRIVLQEERAAIQKRLVEGLKAPDAHRYMTILASLEKQQVELGGELTQIARIIHEHHDDGD